MDLPTYTNIWRIEKRLYKLYDLRLPMPLPLVQIGVFLGVFVPWIVMLRLVGVPFESPWHVLYIVPPGVLTWLATRPVIEGKRLTELLLSQGRYLAEPRTWCRLTPIREPREVVIVARVWRRPGAPAPAPERVAVKSRRRPAPAAEVPAPRDEPLPETPRLEHPTGKRGLISGVRRPGAPDFATTLAPPIESPAPGTPAPAAPTGSPALGPSASGAPAPGTTGGSPALPTAPAGTSASGPGAGTPAPGAPASGASGTGAHAGASASEASASEASASGTHAGAPASGTAAGAPASGTAAGAAASEARADAAASGGEPGDRKVAGPVPTRPDIPMVPGAFGAPEPLVNEAQPRHPGAPAPRPPDRRVAGAEPARPAASERPAPPDRTPQGERPVPAPSPDAPPAAGRQGPAQPAPDRTRQENPAQRSPAPEQPPAPIRPRAAQPPGQSAQAPPSAPAPSEREPQGSPSAPAASEDEWQAVGSEKQPPVQGAVRGTRPVDSQERPSAPAGPGAQRESGQAPQGEGPAAAGEHRLPVAPQGRASGTGRPAAPPEQGGVPVRASGAAPAASAGEPAPARPVESGGPTGADGRPPQHRTWPEADERGGAGAVPQAPRTFGRAPAPEDVPDERPAADGPGRAPVPGHQVPAASQREHGWPPEPDEPETPRLEAPRPWSKGLSQPARPAATDAQMWPPVPEPGVPQDEEPPPRDVRSGPQSPVRPRPLPPPPPPPPSGPAITPPGPEHEVSAGGLRRLFQAVGGGHGDVDAEYQLRLQQPFRGTRHVVVLGCTGGAGQTVTALMLGHTFAQHNAEPVVAIDVNPGPGALARRTRSETNETLTGLITRADQVGSLTAMRRYTSQAKSGLDVIAAGKNPLQALDDRDYALAIRTLDRFYSVTLLDTAAAVVARVLPYADQLVLVAPASADAPRAVAMTYEWLDGHGYEELRSRAVTVINGVSRRSMDDVEQAEAVARGRCRALVRIPWDDHLSMDRGPRNELKSLRAPTRRAYLALAGVVAGGFGVVPERYQELHQEQEATR
ncbi:TcpE family conjugal transfer membrane protein [Actinomadura sediminis]|uniref:TcpE family conjugal transfer membrane protein n=1 Tax=Actinomadura sediminis TaxID=1038904 RepID=A0ABW3F042_9ACTN